MVGWYNCDCSTDLRVAVESPARRGGLQSLDRQGWRIGRMLTGTCLPGKGVPKDRVKRRNLKLRRIEGKREALWAVSILICGCLPHTSFHPCQRHYSTSPSTTQTPGESRLDIASAHRAKMTGRLNIWTKLTIGGYDAGPDANLSDRVDHPCAVSVAGLVE